MKLMEALTSPPGGNKVDGLPPASSFGPKRDFSNEKIKFLRICQFVWALDSFNETLRWFCFRLN